jgi:hypothetical protein
MAKGASSRSGPPPDPMSLRAGEWVKLPAAGRAGDPPVWPLPEQSAREVELWAAEWRRPQALMWERQGQLVEVALYVRRVCEAEVPGSPIAAGTLVRQMQEALGISVPGLQRNRWLIATDEVAPRRESGRKPSARSSSRSRLKVVPGDDSGA